MFWKKKEKQSTDSSVASSTNPFDQTAQTPSLQSNTSSVSDNYSNNTSDYSNNGGRRYNTNEDDRADLFGSSRQSPSQYDSQGQDDAYGRRSQAQQYGEEEDEEVGGLKKQIRDIKQDSLQSTRNALQKINEAEQSAAQSLNQLGTQSSQIANVNRNIDLAKAHSDRASSQADELKQLNRSIFIPVVKNPFNKGARQRRDIERLQADQAEHMEERDNIRQFEQESNARIDQANRRNDRVSANAGYRRGRTQADRNRYQFEADEEDDKIEDELDENLDLLGGATARLKNMAMTMNDELDSQNKQLGKLNTKVDPISHKLTATTATLNKTK
ncbi:hypothetical protein BCR42DRAFT_402177 [Absidia repens]|uniref:t-SNARE coiled-coil homology domain-containing protein n=1 Tax=Absidia repens TaxID=90262 RepID=A0A1X2IXS3_9FUNG|nr:hypothetical protein BCR42DRAFT_402177 [Absidia repens]